jgi:hypothetical protein
LLINLKNNVDRMWTNTEMYVDKFIKTSSFNGYGYYTMRRLAVDKFKRNNKYSKQMIGKVKINHLALFVIKIKGLK